MESFKMKSGSWHLWLANLFTSKWERFDVGDTTDICTYTRRVIRGAFWGSVAGLVLGAVAAWIIFSCGNLFGWLLMGYQLEFVTQLFWFIMACFGIMFSIFAAKEKIVEKLDDIGDKFANRPPKPPGFLTLAYRKFKEKTCFKLEIHE